MVDLAGSDAVDVTAENEGRILLLSPDRVVVVRESNRKKRIKERLSDVVRITV